MYVHICVVNEGEFLSGRLQNQVALPGQSYANGSVAVVAGLGITILLLSFFPYLPPTDKEDSKPSGKSLASLPDFFSHCCFMLYGNFSSADRRLVERYITAYNG